MNRRRILLILYSLTIPLGAIYTLYIVSYENYAFTLLSIPLMIVIGAYLKDSFSRRTFIVLLILLVVLYIPPVYGTMHSSNTCENDKSFSIERANEVSVKVVWCDSSTYANLMSGNQNRVAYTMMYNNNMILGPVEFRDTIYIVEEDELSHRLIMHELGHAIGKEHKESGIMATNTNGIYDMKYPDKEAIEIAQRVDNYVVIDWSSKEDYEFLREEYEKGNLSNRGMMFVSNRYLFTNDKDIYYKHHYNGFGGKYSEKYNNSHRYKFYTLER